MRKLLDLLHTAGLNESKHLIVPIEYEYKCNEIVKSIRQCHLEIVILAQPHSLHHAYQLTLISQRSDVSGNPGQHHIDGGRSL